MWLTQDQTNPIQLGIEARQFVHDENPDLISDCEQEVGEVVDWGVLSSQWWGLSYSSYRLTLRLKPPSESTKDSAQDNAE